MNFLMSMLRRIKGIFPMIKDRKVAWWKKVILIAALVYLFLPMDLIPPVIPVFGWADDLAIWAALLYFMGDDLDAHISAPAGYRTGRYNYNSEDVHEADFTVVEGEEEEKDG